MSLPLTPKVFDTLLCLVRNPGRLLTKDELLKEIWPETFVEEVNLAVNVSALRKVLGEGPQDGRYIATVPGRGYRFVAEVHVVSNGKEHWSAKDPTPGSLLDSKRAGSKPKEHSFAKAESAGRLVFAPDSVRESSWKFAVPIAIVLLLTATVGGYFSFGRRKTGVSVVGAPSIAVLPFADLSPGKDQEYISDGLAEELISDLAKVPDMRVVARSSAFQFKGKNEDLHSIGKKLGVDNVLEGSVRREGDRVRVRVDLTRVGDGFQLWSETYDRKTDDILAVEDEIARAATAALQVKLLAPNAGLFSTAGRRTNPEAYVAYLQGQYFMGRSQESADLNKALAYAEDAIRLDPKYAPAWVLRADVESGMVFAGLLQDTDGFPRSRKDAEQAIRLDPALASAYAQLGSDQILTDWDWEGAAISIRKAAELQPGSADVQHQQAYVDLILGRLNDAIAAQRHAVTLDPLKARSHSFLGFLLYAEGQYEGAISELNKGLELNPQSQSDHFVRARILLAEALPEEARAECDQEPRKFWRLTCESLTYHALGRAEDSEASLKKLIAAHSNDWAYQIAEVFAYRGESDKAFEWLNRAYQQRDDGLLDLKFDPLLKNVRQDTRYTDLLKKMRLPN
jgi:TolB-like protein/DNA-binding winged helix-turn-helix (wHTH) protein/Tfp pilus assembly protein PilF